MNNRYYSGPVSDHFDGKRFFQPGLPNEELLFQLLPPLVRVSLSETTSARVLALLSMNEAEKDSPGPEVISSWRA